MIYSKFVSFPWHHKIVFQWKPFFHIAYCSSFILYICPFIFVILSMKSMGFTIPEFISFEQYIAYSHFPTLMELTGWCNFNKASSKIEFTSCWFCGYVKPGFWLVMEWYKQNIKQSVNFGLLISSHWREFYPFRIGMVRSCKTEKLLRMKIKCDHRII